MLAALLVWGLAGLPHFGAAHAVDGTVLNQESVRERHITDVVTAVNFDYRGFDTLGEEFIFFAAVLGVALMLRPQPGESAGHVNDFATGRAVPPTSDAVRVLGLGLTPPTVLFALYIVAHGHLTPGGGFQGGVILATGVLLIYLAGELDDLRGLYTERALERSEAIGAGGFVAIGLLGVARRIRLPGQRPAAGPDWAASSRPGRSRHRSRRRPGDRGRRGAPVHHLPPPDPRAAPPRAIAMGRRRRAAMTFLPVCRRRSGCSWSACTAS